MILLDTCALLWLSGDPPRLPQRVMTSIRNAPPGQRFISAISIYEIGVKCEKGKLILPKKLRIWIDQMCGQRGLTVLPITKDIACRAIELPKHHNDPADRMIISTALEYNLVILSPDRLFKKYSAVKTVWE